MRKVAKMILVVAVAWPSIAAAAEEFDPFVGKFVGESVQISGTDQKKRDLTVEIAKSGKGFLVSWRTVIHKSSGKDEEQPPDRVRFVPTRRDHIYSAASRQDMFGKQVPIDPISGKDPYYWARIQDKTLSVYNIIINDDGGYEMQVYHRTLTDGGMRVEFQRMRDGVPQRTVTGILKRVK
ncbi:MAG: hypothetical protein KIT16_04005 [Rhodospirillaceae bacterium]|nr:hypothetical protein [Rhodospirillaceae bacterium]